jgi:hypothetical protein
MDHLPNDLEQDGDILATSAIQARLGAPYIRSLNRLAQKHGVPLRQSCNTCGWY